MRMVSNFPIIFLLATPCPEKYPLPPGSQERRTSTYCGKTRSFTVRKGTVHATLEGGRGTSPKIWASFMLCKKATRDCQLPLVVFSPIHFEKHIQVVEWVGSNERRRGTQLCRDGMSIGCVEGAKAPLCLSLPSASNDDVVGFDECFLRHPLLVRGVRAL